MKKILKGERTRQEILGTTVDIASADGLQGLTIGKLAADLKMSKSGLYAHFGSKEQLQLSTVEAASEIFIHEIIEPTKDAENGLVKLCAMLEAWISYVERSVFKGGCFFFAASAEMDDRPGRVRDLIAQLTLEWIRLLEKEAGLAVRLGELKTTCDVELLVFQLHGSVQEANWFYRLHEDETAFTKTRKSVLQCIELRATASGRAILEQITGAR